MKLSLKIIPITILSALSLNALAGDEQVNCRDEIIDHKPVYGGLAQCDASYTVKTCKPKPNGFDIITENKTMPLSRDFIKHDKEWVNLSKYITYYESYGAGPNACTIPSPVNERINCSAKLDYLGQEAVKERVCDYTPNASVSSYADEGSTDAYVNVIGSDRDGTIIKKELWVNGVKQSGSSTVLRGNAGDVFNVTAKVTDNDNYTDSTSKSVTLVFRPIARCGSHFC